MIKESLITKSFCFEKPRHQEGYGHRRSFQDLSSLPSYDGKNNNSN